MLRDLPLEEFQKHGIEISGNEMENGEFRFRLSSKESSYIRVEEFHASSWQKSHFHREQSECFLIEKGMAIVATVENEEVFIHTYRSGGFLLIGPMIAHNVFFTKGSISHTIKWGGQSDWNAFPELDEYIKKHIIIHMETEGEGM